MFDASLPTPRDIARRAKLRQLATSSTQHAAPSALPAAFRVRAWRWHHLGVVRDLARLERGLQTRSRQLCSRTAGRETRQQVLDAVRYIITDNWQLHDFVETQLFVPWMRAAPPRDAVFERRAALLAEERDKVQREAAALTAAVQRWVVGREGCERGRGNIAQRVGRLKENAKMLFEASEAVFVPRVVGAFSEKEQVRFNKRVLGKITGRQARVSLVVFDDAVEKGEPIVASESDRQQFESDVPVALRKWAVPMWRRKFVAHKAKFIAGGEAGS